MDMFNDKNYSKALVIGAGSGRDIASAVLVTEKLRKVGIGLDLAGFLTPWALHTFDGELEQPVNELTGNRNTKFIASRQGVSLDSYFEPELVKLNTELGLGIDKFYLLSLQYGTTKPRDQLERLIRKNAYDAIIAVDVGGDILARKQDYPWLLTPLVDFSCLSILASLPSTVDSYLAVVAPGVDGEIPRQNLQEIFKELESKGFLLYAEALRKENSNYQVFQRVNDRINARTRSYSNTYRLIEKVVSSPRERVFETVRKKLSVMERRWELVFPVELRRSLTTGVYYFDLKTIHSVRDVGLSYKDIFGAFVKLKELGAGGTEVDLSFVPGSIEAGTYEDTVFFLTPPERVDHYTRKAVLEYGIRLTAQRAIERSVMLDKDRQALNLPYSSHAVQGVSFI